MFDSQSASLLTMISVADTDNQRVIIKVKDVNDEPPYFINRPLPMQVRTAALLVMSAVTCCRRW